jgi:REP element-mobilizing transposase RayT
MARPLRFEHKNAVYHVTARGNERQKIFREDGDKARFLQLLSRVVEEQGLIIHAYVLMDNHYHLMAETPNANLAESLRQLNGVYTQWFNHKYHRAGHLFQGRYKAILVGKETHLVALCIYLALNPVRAKMVKHPKDYPWSSYRATAGLATAPGWLETKWLLKQFGRTRKSAQEGYRKAVLQRDGLKESPFDEVEGQIYLGSREFLDKLKKQITKEDREVPAAQRRVRASSAEEVLEKVVKVYGLKGAEELTRRRRDGEARRVAMYWMRVGAGKGLKAVGEVFGFSYSTVSHQVGWVRREMVGNAKLAQRVVNCNPKT